MHALHWYFTKYKLQIKTPPKGEHLLIIHHSSHLCGSSWAHGFIKGARMFTQSWQADCQMLGIHYYSDVTWHLKSRAALFAQQHVQDNNKENIKAMQNWFFKRKSTDDHVKDKKYKMCTRSVYIPSFRFSFFYFMIENRKRVPKYHFPFS